MELLSRFELETSSLPKAHRKPFHTRTPKNHKILAYSPTFAVSRNCRREAPAPVFSCPPAAHPGPALKTYAPQGIRATQSPRAPAPRACPTYRRGIAWSGTNLWPRLVSGHDNRPRPARGGPPMGRQPTAPLCQQKNSPPFLGTAGNLRDRFNCCTPGRGK